MSSDPSTPILEANLGWAIGCSRIGAAHVRDQKPCQDAYAIWGGSEAGSACLALAVADGHGDQRHDLSQHGAALAVKVAVNELVAFQRSFGERGSEAALRSSFKADFPRRVNRRWRAAVLDDARGRCAHLSEDPDDNQRIFSRYGTTLLAALIVADSIHLAQIGDGDVVVIRPDGAVEQPLPRDDSLVGNETYSLASPAAPNLWQTTSLARGPGGFLLLATDGLGNSFIDAAQFHIFARSLTERVHEFGLATVAASLAGWLDHFTTHGSGDDITLALASIRPQAEA